MKGTPSFSDQFVSPEPKTQWTAGLGRAIRDGRRLPQRLQTNVSLELVQTVLGLWLILGPSRKVKVALRVPYDPAGFQSLQVTRREADVLEIAGTGGLGEFDIRIAMVGPSGTMLRCTTTLTPRCPLRLAEMPHDMCVLDTRFEPWPEKARLMTCQKGNTAPQAFLQVPGRPGATIFYFHNLTALAELFASTGANATGCVSVRWPEAGIALPAGTGELPAKRPVVTQDAFLEVQRGVPESEAHAAEMFLGALAKVYAEVGQPQFEYYDWPAAARRSLRALTAKTGCCRNVAGKLYVQAYVNCDKKPPESMVQGALAVPLMEYEAWRRRSVPLLRKLAHYPASFYDKRLRSPVRWLAGADFKKSERSEEEHHFLMDSWYLLHTLLNIGRIAELGHASARDIFLDSIATLIRTAHHFNYDWPVFYDQRTLKVRKRETEDGKGGEQDAAGLYAHVMLQAYDFTHDRKYLREAETSAMRLEGLAFGVLYQTNATAIAAVALGRLWRLTGKSAYRELSTVCVASIMSHLWLWNLGSQTRTFMALPPLHDAPYVAFYEEAEVLAALQSWQTVMGKEVPAGMRSLLAEYQQCLLARGHFYFPTDLPRDAVESSPKEGPIHPRLPIPLEGLGTSRDKAGTVGQAVYAAGAAFVLAARCWHRPRVAPLTIFCSYPVSELEQGGTPKQGNVKFDVTGVPELMCTLTVLRSGRSGSTIELTCDGRRRSWSRLGKNGRSVTIPGGSRVLISWR
ncbi:MAG: hypothetical protein ABUL62_33925 [Myxococcales bacterium]